MAAASVSGSTYAQSVVSSKSSSSLRARAERGNQHGNEDFLDRRSPLENGIFGVLFTLSKENSETRIRIRWVILKIILDAWQLFTTIISPSEQRWKINARGVPWQVFSILNFTWLEHLGYGAYLAVLYSMVALLAINVGLCIWVAWCFKEHKFPVVWPIKALRAFSSVFFQAFDVTSLNLLQLGISCRYTGSNVEAKLHLDLFPKYSCSSTPHIMHAVVSALSMALFVAIALLLNMAEVEVNPLSRRPLALGHSGAEVMAFAIKALLTLVNVFIGWPRVAACVYLALSLALAYQTLRWCPNLVAWVNYLKSGVSVAILWCAIVLTLLEFHPGISDANLSKWQEAMTYVMFMGLLPTFAAGALFTRSMLRRMTNTALKALATASPDVPLKDVCINLDHPRDVEIVARCCRVWQDRYHLDPEAVAKAHQVIKAGVAMFPGNAYMVLLHGNFMIDALGVSQSGGVRIEEARKLNPGLMSRFIMFVRQQQATQQAACNSANEGASMDLLGYVEYQRKQRMVVRLHRDALQAMCNFWRALDASRVSFTHLSKCLGKIETSVTQATTAYRVVLERYGNNSKLVRLYGKFLQTIKNDPWRASEYFAEADRLEEVKDGDSAGPLLPDGTPLGRMDEVPTAVLVINSTGEMQMANRHTHVLFGFKRGALEGKPIGALLAPQYALRINEKLVQLVAGRALTTACSSLSSADDVSYNDVIVGMRCDRLAFPIKLSLRKASGVGEDSTFIAIMETVPPVHGVASLWVALNGTVVACDPAFVSTFGWKPSEINGTSLMAFMSVVFPERQNSNGDQESALSTSPAYGESASEVLLRLLCHARNMSEGSAPTSLKCLVAHKYANDPLPCNVNIVENGDSDIPVHEVRVRLIEEQQQILVISRKGAIVHATPELATCLKDTVRPGQPHRPGALGGGGFVGGFGNLGGNNDSRQGAGAGGGARFAGGNAGGGVGAPAQPGGPPGAGAGDALAGYTLADFLTSPWREMHFKYLKDTTTVTPPNHSHWGCRTPTALAGPTMELRTTSGHNVYMQVSVTTADISGELHHVIHMNRSSQEAALAERRLRLSIDAGGLIVGISDGIPKHVFGLDTNQVVGRGLWEVVRESSSEDGDRMLCPGPQLFTALLTRALTHPGYSWRVLVAPPQKTIKAGMMNLAAVTRASLARPAVMQVHVEVPTEDAVDETTAPVVYVDLWPLTAVTGVLDLDYTGRIRAVMEEDIRPVGLLFGMPSQSLIGSTIDSLVTMPPGRSRASDLLTLHGAKKSSLKSNKKELTTKMGPVHVLQGVHVDGGVTHLDVQMVGKPGPNQPLHVILRFHTIPMLPTAGGSVLPPPTAVVNVNEVSTTPMKATASGLINANMGLGGMRPSLRASFCVSMRDSLRVSNITRLVPSGKDTPIKVGKDSPESGVALHPTTPKVAGFSGGVIMSHTSWNEANGGKSAATAVQRTISDEAVVLTPGAMPLGPTGYSNVLIDETPLSMLPSPVKLMAGMEDGLPVPGVTLGAKGVYLNAGRSKLGDMVKTMEGSGHKLTLADGKQGSSGDGSGVGASGRVLRPGSSRFGSGVATRDSAGEIAVNVGKPSFMGSPGATAAQVVLVPGMLADLDGLQTAPGKGEVPKTGDVRKAPFTGVDMQSIGDSDENNSDKEMRPHPDGNGRISTWVASKGAFYQNSVGAHLMSDEDRRNSDISDVGGGTQPFVLESAISLPESAKLSESGYRKAAIFSPGGASNNSFTTAGYADDDQASEGGQSAMSAQSGTGGAEYKRGKRFRKLKKLMDSSQAQQVQQRFRVHALLTVAVLAIVHIICFALIVRAIQAQRERMLNLSRSGEAIRYMQGILTDVRSLDQIVKNKMENYPHLYTRADAPFFVQRISTSALLIKERLNSILADHHSESSNVTKVLFYTLQKSWNGNDIDGSDLWTNLTIWDFAARFYMMSTTIVQNYDTWSKDGTDVSNTNAGQFLLKSGPDLFRVSRKILDALLIEAADNVHWVDILQLIFLAVEGTAISSLAAFYLAILLRAVAAQRHKLYATFLVIPLGLTRALASQSTTLLVDDDDDDDSDYDDEHGGDEGAEEEEGEAAAKVKRRATLAISNSGALPATSGSGDRRSLGRSTSLASGDRRPRDGQDLRGSPDKTEKYDKMRTGTNDSVDPARAVERSRGWGLRSLWRYLTRRTGGVTPLPQTSSGNSHSLSTKRQLADDSHTTVLMMFPFVLWSVLVITIYSIAVIQMKGVVEVVAIHSVTNFMAARTYRSIHFSQEVAVVDNPADLDARRVALTAVIKLMRDAWYTLQLGLQAKVALGPDVETFPLVKTGLAFRTPHIADLFYGTNYCHRLTVNLPCYPKGHRFYEITHTSLDAMMQQHFISMTSIATNKSMVPEGLGDEHFDYIYNVGARDLADGVIQISRSHYDAVLAFFHEILVLHISLFMVLWVVFSGFLVLMLNPLLDRIAKERRRIAELMSQLPLELDVEKLVAKALGTTSLTTAAGATPTTESAGVPAPRASISSDPGYEPNGGDEAPSKVVIDTASKWKAIIRSASSSVRPPKARRASNVGNHLIPQIKS